MSEADLSSYLLAGEQLVWTGHPVRGIVFTARDVFLVPFSLLWLGFAVFWEVGVATSNAPPFFLLWGLMFVLLGLVFAFGRFGIDAWIRGRQTYAVTNRRVLIIRPAPFAKFTALNLDQLPVATLHERSSGRGDVRFGETPFFGFGGRNAFGGWIASLDPNPQFIGIEDARAVFNRVQSLASARKL